MKEGASMYTIRRDNRLKVGLFVASMFFQVFTGYAQAQSPVPQSSLTGPDSSIKEIYKKWLGEEVVWIVSDRERIDFQKLSTDKQRDHFVVAFWERRNPTPGSSENKFKEEHYRRLAYTNTHFAMGVPGWKTDRGRVYILYGR
jgi:GWxTD domain-containing protein